MSRTGKRSSSATLSANLPGAKRLKHELQAMQTNPPPLCSAGLKKDDDLFEWTAIISGPPDSVYEGGSFSLNLKFPKVYPYNPPQVLFTTKIYHCNVDEYGNVCLDILHCNWTPAMTVSTLLLSICSLLTDPNPNSPLRSDIALLYKKNRRLHDSRARDATARYAVPK